ncbi:hypothetical protein RCL_jg3917.t1 [Rhizophagus clarus]|uniref:Uncharacterized protein n=1 Tax=Rhizophagus clarus TaxID=94130 RepID=A0A8H3KU07_9GLOM|nr:hypothetical protein RCL_jg3917.t1 [Rhizophagus clarus]
MNLFHENLSFLRFFKVQQDNTPVPSATIFTPYRMTVRSIIVCTRLRSKTLATQSLLRIYNENSFANVLNEQLNVSTLHFRFITKKA